MKHSCCWLQVLFLVAAFLNGNRLHAQMPVPRFGLYEAAFQSAQEYANGYTDMDAEAEIKRPDGTVWRLPLFWDGGKVWKLRISPDATGEWSYVVRSEDPGLDGKAGRFKCQPSDLKGSILPMKEAPRHFQYQNGEPMWFLGDTAWALFTESEKEKHDRKAAEKYLEARASQGFNVVHSMLLSEAGWGNSGGLPFEEISQERLNPNYFQEADHRIAYANSQHLIVGIALAWGDKGRQEPFAWRKFPHLESRKRYARYVAARYGAFHSYFLISGEWHAEIGSRRQNEEVVRKEFIEIGDALAKADAHDRMIGIHPMTSGGSVREFHEATWMSFGDYQQNYSDLHARILESLKFNQPVVNSEYGYFLRDQSGDGVPDKDNSTRLESMRHASWDIVMAGGYLVTGFGTTYFGGHRDPGPFDLDAEKNDAWETQIGYIKKCFAEVQWWKLMPHDELITCEILRGKDGRHLGQTAPPAATYWALAEPGKQYIVYVRGTEAPEAPVLLKLPEGKTNWRVQEFNPRTGSRQEAKREKTEDGLILKPQNKEDWVFLIDAKAE